MQSVAYVQTCRDRNVPRPKRPRPKRPRPKRLIPKRLRPKGPDRIGQTEKSCSGSRLIELIVLKLLLSNAHISASVQSYLSHILPLPRSLCSRCLVLKPSWRTKYTFFQNWQKIYPPKLTLPLQLLMTFFLSLSPIQSHQPVLMKSDKYLHH